MKFRKDFVTNSSSSSYICDICDREECGYDLSLSDIYMNECENGHVFCQDHMTFDTFTVDSFKKAVENDRWLDSSLKEKIRYSDESLETLIDMVKKECDNYSIPAFMCPICSFNSVSMSDVEKYKSAKLRQTDEAIKKEIKEKFDCYDDFKKYIDSRMREVK